MKDVKTSKYENKEGYKKNNIESEIFSHWKKKLSSYWTKIEDLFGNVFKENLIL